MLLTVLLQAAEKVSETATSVFGNGENIVIFPEDSTNGYLENLEGFYNGFILLCEMCYKKGIDVPVYVTYFRKKE